jgi:Fe-S cluster biogenesis protein NfuA
MKVNKTLLNTFYSKLPKSLLMINSLNKVNKNYFGSFLKQITSNKNYIINKTKNFNSFSFKHFSIFVKTGETPNPNFLKFYPGKEVMPEGETFDISNKKEALISPLATKLFDVKGVTRIFYGNNYISVGKEELTDWADVKPLIIDEIVKFYSTQTELFTEKPSHEDTDIKDDDSEAVQLIKEIIAARIRPVVQEDGGDIKFITFDETDGTVYLQMKGSCSGCPSSGVTLKNGIEKMLMHYVAEVKSVEEYAEDEIDQ